MILGTKIETGWTVLGMANKGNDQMVQMSDLVRWCADTWGRPTVLWRGTNNELLRQTQESRWARWPMDDFGYFGRYGYPVCAVFEPADVAMVVLFGNVRWPPEGGWMRPDDPL